MSDHPNSVVVHANLDGGILQDKPRYEEVVNAAWHAAFNFKPYGNKNIIEIAHEDSSSASLLVTSIINRLINLAMISEASTVDCRDAVSNCKKNLRDIKKTPRHLRENSTPLYDPPQIVEDLTEAIFAAIRDPKERFQLHRSALPKHEFFSFDDVSLSDETRAAVTVFQEFLLINGAKRYIPLGQKIMASSSDPAYSKGLITLACSSLVRNKERSYLRALDKLNYELKAEIFTPEIKQTLWRTIHEAIQPFEHYKTVEGITL